MIKKLFITDDEIDHEESFNDGKIYAAQAEQYAQFVTKSLLFRA